MSRTEASCEICTRPDQLDVLWFCNGSHHAHRSCVEKIHDRIFDIVKSVFTDQDPTELLYTQIEIRQRIKIACEGNILAFFNQKGAEEFEKLVRQNINI